jgi:hypothetical protein
MKNKSPVMAAVLLAVIALAVAGLARNQLVPGAAVFKSITPQVFAGVIGWLFAVSLFVERAIEVIVMVFRDEQADLLDYATDQAGKAVTEAAQRAQAGAWTFSVTDLRDLPALAAKLKLAGEAVPAFLKTKLPAATLTLLTNYQGLGSDPVSLQTTLVGALNTIIATGAIYDAQRFAGVALRPETQMLLAQNPQGESLLRLNRLLLEDAFPAEIARNANVATGNDPGRELAAGAAAQARAELAAAQKRQVLYRAETKEFALQTGFLIGTLASLAGVRALTGMLADPGTAGPLFTVADILITGAMLAGGSEGIHRMANAFTGLMDGISARADQAQRNAAQH